MNGGNIIVHGDAGDYVGGIMKGGNIVIEGDVGEFAGKLMFGGNIIINGRAGSNLGDFMIYGGIFVAGDIRSLGKNAKEGKLTTKDKKMIRDVLNKYGIKFTGKDFKKIIAENIKPFSKGAV